MYHFFVIIKLTTCDVLRRTKYKKQTNIINQITTQRWLKSYAVIAETSKVSVTNNKLNKQQNKPTINQTAEFVTLQKLAFCYFV